MSKIKPFIFSSFDENEAEETKVDRSDKGSKQQAPVINIEEQIQRQYEEHFKEGFERGYREGYEKGYQEGKQEAQKNTEEELKGKVAELKDQIELFKKISAELAKFKEKQLELLLPQIMRLSFKIAEKIVATKISLDREITLEILKEALNEVPLNEESIIVKLNPEDLTLLADRIHEIGVDPKKLKLEPLSKLKRGELEIETESLHIVSTLEKKLEEIENAINSLLSKQS